MRFLLVCVFALICRGAFGTEGGEPEVKGLRGGGSAGPASVRGTRPGAGGCRDERCDRGVNPATYYDIDDYEFIKRFCIPLAQFYYPDRFDVEDVLANVQKTYMNYEPDPYDVEYYTEDMLGLLSGRGPPTWIAPGGLTGPKGVAAATGGETEPKGVAALRGRGAGLRGGASSRGGAPPPPPPPPRRGAPPSNRGGEQGGEGGYEEPDPYARTIRHLRDFCRGADNRVSKPHVRDEQFRRFLRRTQRRCVDCYEAVEIEEQFIELLQMGQVIPRWIAPVIYPEDKTGPVRG